MENVASWLNAKGIPVEAYHGSVDDELRLAAEDKLQSNSVKALVATTALGMGYDKPDLGFVVHFQSPGSPVAYYQQVGRAGRALTRSEAVLLRGREDEQIQNFFIETAFAPEETVSDIVRAFDTYGGPASLVRIQHEVNVKHSVLELVAKQLDVEGVLERVGGTSYQRTFKPWAYPADRIEQVTAARRAEQRSMVDYLHTRGCRMRFIANLLDDPSQDDCGICDNCTGRTADRALPIELVAEAERYLLSRPITLVPKKMYYDPSIGARRRIPDNERIEDGRVLAMWGDAGWGELVRAGKKVDGPFDDRLVEAMTTLIEEWAPDPRPAWVTCVPSLRHPKLVPEFAERVAERLGLPFHPIIEKVAERPAQKLQENSPRQQRNVEGAFRVSAKAPRGPVLLVDDVVDSTWTLTEIGRVLRRAGVPVVHPVALASSAGRE